MGQKFRLGSAQWCFSWSHLGSFTSLLIEAGSSKKALFTVLAVSGDCRLESLSSPPHGLSSRLPQALRLPTASGNPQSMPDFPSASETSARLSFANFPLGRAGQVTWSSLDLRDGKMNTTSYWWGGQVGLGSARRGGTMTAIFANNLPQSVSAEMQIAAGRSLEPHSARGGAREKGGAHVTADPHMEDTRISRDSASPSVLNLRELHHLT